MTDETMTVETSNGLETLDELVKRTARLQRQVKRLQAEVKGHREHVADVLGPNPCDETAEYELGGRKVQVIHNHPIDAARMAELYPRASFPLLWQDTVRTDVARAILTAEQVKPLLSCGDHYVKVS